MCVPLLCYSFLCVVLSYKLFTAFFESAQGSLLHQKHGSAFRKYRYATKWERAANLCERERTKLIRKQTYELGTCSKIMVGDHAANM